MFESMFGTGRQLVLSRLSLFLWTGITVKVLKNTTTK